jgi:hypothetical protein
MEKNHFLDCISENTQLYKKIEDNESCSSCNFLSERYLHLKLSREIALEMDVRILHVAYS